MKSNGTDIRCSTSLLPGCAHPTARAAHAARQTTRVVEAERQDGRSSRPAPQSPEHPTSIHMLARVRQEAHREGGGGLVGQYSVNRRRVDLEQRGDHLHGFALGAELADMGHLLRHQLGLRAALHPALLGGCDTGTGALGHQAALEFGQDADHLPHGAAGGLGVDVLG